MHITYIPHELQRWKHVDFVYVCVVDVIMHTGSYNVYVRFDRRQSNGGSN